MFKIKAGDMVQVLVPRESPPIRSKVRKVLPKENRAIVEDVNVHKKHIKPGTRQALQTGIVDIELPINLSNLALVCNKCGKATRVGFRFLADGTKARFCKKCGELT
ncbi:MAG: large subunit ribosomal protein [Chloroflexota bacterium]|jgi:large subunit ribosomal protein L24|nr:large subunit ribosomal protein [Chloroflexota bacterium]